VNPKGQDNIFELKLPAIVSVYGFPW